MKTTQIPVQNPPEVVIGTGPMAFRRPYYSGGLVIVKVTSPCVYCGKPVTYYRSGLFQGSNHHEDCRQESGDAQAQYEAQKSAILNGLTESEYQAKHGIAWNE